MARHLDGGGIWRYRPTTGQLEVFSKGWSIHGVMFLMKGASLTQPMGLGQAGSTISSLTRYLLPHRAQRWLKGLNPGSPKHCGLACFPARMFLRMGR